jgi:hypothetical protein
MRLPDGAKEFGFLCAGLLMIQPLDQDYFSASAALRNTLE